MLDDRHEMRAGGLSATVLAKGAELCSLLRKDGRELIWQAGPMLRCCFPSSARCGTRA